MVETASLIADMHAVRCGDCKVIVEDPMAIKCTICGAVFDRVVSNHVGLAARLNSSRAGLQPETEADEELVAVPRSVLAAVAGALGKIEAVAGAAAVVAALAEGAPAVDAGEVAEAAVAAAESAREAGSLD